MKGKKKSKVHKSLWSDIFVMNGVGDFIDFPLDSKGRLLKSFSKSRPRKLQIEMERHFGLKNDSSISKQQSQSDSIHLISGDSLPKSNLNSSTELGNVKNNYCGNPNFLNEKKASNDTDNIIDFEDDFFLSDFDGSNFQNDLEELSFDNIDLSWIDEIDNK